MRMLMTAMLALSLLTGAVSVSFAEDKPEKKEHKKKAKKGKKDEAKKS